MSTLDAPPLEVAGRAVVEMDGATCFVAPGWVGVRDGDSTLRLTKRHASVTTS